MQQTPKPEEKKIKKMKTFEPIINEINKHSYLPSK
jgi:hypothetical protein